MATQENTQTSKKNVRHTHIRRIIVASALFLGLFGKHANAQQQSLPDDMPKNGDKKELSIKGHAGLVQPMLMINTNENGGFTARGATLAVANGGLKYDGWELSGNSLFLANADFNDAKFNALMTVFNGSLKKTIGENSSIKINAGRFMKGQEMHFANGIQAPQYDLYTSLLKKFGNQSDVIQIGYETTVGGTKTFGEIGFAVPARGGVNMFVNMNDPNTRQFIMNLGLQSNDVLGIDAISIKGGAKVKSDGTTVLSGNLAVKEGKTGISASVQDVNPKDGSGLWLLRITQETERFGTLFINADGTFTDNLGNKINLTFGIDGKKATIEAGIQTTKTSDGTQTAATGGIGFKLLPNQSRNHSHGS